MSRRLLLSYLGLAVLILAMLEIPLAVLGARYERDVAISQDQKAATGVAIAASEDFEQLRTADLNRVVVRYRAATGGEVSIVDSAGGLVASADDDHDRDIGGPAAPFVRSALSGGLAGAIVNDEHRAVVVVSAPIGEPTTRTGAVVLLVPAQSPIERIHVFWTALASFAVFILAAALAIGRWMTNAISRPLEGLGRTVAALGESNLEIRAEVDDGPAEVRALALQFNQMANRLTELVEAQGNFVADASHQLRSPLTALRLRIENLEAELPSSESAAVAAIGDEVLRLSRLVDGLISMGHADAVTPETAAVDVEAVIEERCRAWAALAQERKVILASPPGFRQGPTPSRSAVVVPGDLDQILDNLLANALDASPPSSQITVSVVDVDDFGFEIHIIDQGPGMTDAQLERAFDRFWQGSSTTGSHGGLGLAIVRQLGIRNDIRVRLNPAQGGGLDAVVAMSRTRRRRTARVPLHTGPGRPLPGAETRVL